MALARVQNNAPAVPAQAETTVLSLDQYRSQGYNILLPTTSVQSLSPFHKPRLELVSLSTNAGDGDVYTSSFCKKDGYGKDASYVEAALTKNGLFKLAMAAGVTWVPSQCRRVDDMKDPAYVCYEAVGYIRRLDGSCHVVKGMKEIDLRAGGAEEAKLKKMAASKMKAWGNREPELKSQREADEWVAKELLAAREHKLSNCETKAHLRAVRALLTIKSKYSWAELEKPFVVLHLDFSPDYTDPETRRIMITAAAQAQAGLYGGVMTDAGRQAEEEVREMQSLPETRPAPPLEVATTVSHDDEDDDCTDDDLPTTQVSQQPNLDVIIDGTPLHGWMKSLRDVETHIEYEAMAVTLRRFKNEIKQRAGEQVWDEILRLCKAKVAEFQGGK